ncbi:Cathepsin_B [Hexamita inflata]|uniref:Cathepsin B n=1 Tax=Hexamita inflata TaxID=28002 RepID=A0AA86R0J1_9EUKA|nr:Cathepsin B [Hexamita inflata]
MLLTQILSQQFNKQAVVELLKNIPDMTWTPAVNEHHRNMSSSFNVKRSFNAFPLFTQIVTVPQAFSWLEEKPECLKVRDHGDCGSTLAFQAVGQFSDNRCISKFDKTRINYSEQYQISCDAVDLGCEGGYLAQGMYYIKSNGVPTILDCAQLSRRFLGRKRLLPCHSRNQRMRNRSRSIYSNCVTSFRLYNFYNDYDTLRNKTILHIFSHQQSEVIVQYIIMKFIYRTIRLGVRRQS